MPAPPGKAKRVTDFGAVANDDGDDTAAIQRAIDALAPGEWLVFPPGRYIHSQAIHVNKPDIVLWGEGATLHASNPSSQALLLEADGASVYKFTLTAETIDRRTTPWESRIAVFGGVNPNRLLSRNVIRGNKVVWGGAPGTPLQNSSSAAGIFIFHAADFLVAENTVARTLADAIHITEGSYNGRILRNEVKEAGDDMIGTVSYVATVGTSASTIAADFARRKASGLNHDLLIADNVVSGQYWGRGITVVGGENIIIERNAISKTTHAAALYIARETSYMTFGVKNVIVRNNSISDVQETRPDYVVGAQARSFITTGHGGIEVYSHVYTDEAADSMLADAFAVQQLSFENNTVDWTKADGMRIGQGSGAQWALDGRTATGGKVGRIAVASTTFSRIGGTPLAILSGDNPASNVMCTGNRNNGATLNPTQCSGTRPAVTGTNFAACVKS